MILAVPTLWNKIGQNGNGIPTSLSDFTQLLFNILGILLFAAGALAVVYMVIGGVMYVSSAGSEKQVNSAKSTITSAITGLIIALLSYTIIKFIQGRF